MIIWYVSELLKMLDGHKVLIFLILKLPCPIAWFLSLHSDLEVSSPLRDQPKALLLLTHTVCRGPCEFLEPSLLALLSVTSHQTLLGEPDS